MTTSPERPAPPTTTTTTTTTLPAVQGTASVTPDCTGATVAMSGWASGTYVELSLDGEPWLVVTQSGAWAWPQHPADGVHYWAAFLPDGTFVHGEFNTCTIETAPTTTTVLIPEVAAVSASQSDAPVLVTSTTEAPQVVVASVAVLPATGTTTAPLVGMAGTSLLLGVVLVVAALRRRLL